MTPRLLARLRADLVHVHDLTAPPLPGTHLSEPAATFPVPSGDHPEGCAASPDLTRAVYSTADAVVCLASDGRTVWRHPVEPTPDNSYSIRTSCAFTADGTVVWVCRPHPAEDVWLALDAASGTPRGRFVLGTAGHGGEHHAHPGGTDMLLDVGEGQDGTVIFRGRLTGSAVELLPYPWADRVLIDLAPDGRSFLTVDHAQEDVALHSYPDGEVQWRCDAAAFGPDLEDAYVEWNGGYLDTDTVVVTISHADGYRHHRVAAGTGLVLGPLETPSLDEYDLRPLGDGSWLTTDGGGHLWRHS
ncbi:hypothetical protein Lfu02_42050 [Longispora fulva]|uniref:Uncharacterized protein n=1 Tax=Longispora fulva TaxID=619741 RepID=A0A8J7GPP1_9ACTN|nr:hypothetical protein [Longispora fulva]MBG6136664.1 hypothetical protein [Longispora fulva]GIG59833.1 hypothetical protein Lfu02_42050 [Longispora fulva]